jgi:hypothetical protein
MERTSQDERGQAYALEGIIGAIIVVSALVLGLQAVDVAPWTGNQEFGSSETRAELSDTLAVAEDLGALQTALTCVDDDGNPHPEVAATDDGVTEFGEVLNQTLDDQYTYRISVEYPTASGYESTQIGPRPPLAEVDTVSVTRYLTLSDSDPVYEVEDGQCQQFSTLGEEESDIYLEDPAPSGNDHLFAVVRVRVIAW